MEELLHTLNSIKLSDAISTLALIVSSISSVFSFISIRRSDIVIALDRADKSISIFTGLKQEWKEWQGKLSEIQGKFDNLSEEEQINALKEITDTTMRYAVILLSDRESFNEPISIEMESIFRQVKEVYIDNEQDLEHRKFILYNVMKFLEGPYICYIDGRLAQHRKTITK